MSIEVSAKTFSWLTSINVVSKASGTESRNRKIKLDTRTSMALENGVTVGKILHHLLKQLEGETVDRETLRVEPLKELNTPQARLYNWSLLVKALVAINLKIDSDTKSLLVAGDIDVAAEVMEDLCRRYEQVLKEDAENMGRNGSDKNLLSSSRYSQGQVSMAAGSARERRGKKAPHQRNLNKNTSIDIVNLNISKPPADTSNCVEFLLNTLCRSMDLNSKQAAGLLTGGNKYLAHILIKGVKGVFDPVLQWYQEVNNNLEHLLDLIIDEEQQGSVSMILSALRPGLLSKNGEVVEWAGRVITQLGSEFYHHDLNTAGWEWFISDNGGLDGSILSLKRHPEAKDEISDMLLKFGAYNMMELYTVLLKNCLEDPNDYFYIMHELLLPMVSVETTKEEIITSGIYDFWLDQAIKTAEDGRSHPDGKIRSAQFLCELWMHYSERFEEREENTNKMLAILKAFTRDKTRTVKFAGLTQMFHLLEQFSNERNPFAPVFYKSLTFALVENHADLEVREYMMANFIDVFENNAAMPINILLEPLLKQLQVSEGITYHYQTFDFDFFVTMARHQRLTTKNAIQILDFLAKVYLNDIVYSRAAGTPFLFIISRHADEEPVRNFVEKFSQIGLGNFVQLEKKRKPKPVQLPKYNNRPVKVGAKTSVEDQQREHLNLQKRGLVLEMHKKLLNMKNDTISEKLKDNLIRTNYQLKAIRDRDHPGLVSCLEVLGDAQEMLLKFEVDNAESLVAVEEKELAEHEQSGQLPNDLRRSADSNITDRSATSEELLAAEMLRQQQEEEEAAMNRYALVAKPKKKGGSIKRKALDNLAELRRKRAEVEEKKKAQDDQREQKTHKQKKALKAQLEKRKIELGVAQVNEKDASKNLVFNDGAHKQYKMKEKVVLPQIELLDLDLEEPNDREAVILTMKKYVKPIKVLFSRYSNTGYNSRKNSTSFDALGGGFKSMKNAEILIMLRDLKVMPKYLNKDELAVLVRLINQKLDPQTRELTSLTPDGFKEFMLQLANFMYSRPPTDLSHLPPVVSYQALMDYFKDTMKANGEKVLAFDDPDSISHLGDADVIKQLNERLKQNPQYSLPEGYKKVVDKKVEIKHELPEALKIPQKFRDCIEIMDDILSEAIGVHFIEPRSEYITSYRARPIIEKPKVESQFMKYDPARNKLPALKQKPEEELAKDRLLEKRKVVNQSRPLLAPSLKFEITNNFTKKDRGHATEVAFVLEEMLQAASKGKSNLGDKYRGIGQVKNRVIQKREEEEVRKKEEHEDRERKRKLRMQVVSKEQKKINEENAKKKAEADKAKEQAAADKAKEEKLKAGKRKELRKAVNKAKKDREEEEKKKKEEDDAANAEKRKADEAEKKKKHAEFLASQKQKQAEQFKNLEKKHENQRDGYQEKMAEEEKKKKQKEKERAEKMLKQEREKRAKEVERNEKIQQLKDNPEVQACFKKHKKALKHLYQFYCKASDSQEITFDLESRLNTLQFKDFLKLCRHFNIYPTIATKDDVIFIFRQLTREKNVQPPTINFDDFLEGLLRISAIGEKVLNGKESMEDLKERADKEAEENASPVKTKKTTNFDPEEVKKDEGEAVERQSTSNLGSPKKSPLKSKKTVFTEGYEVDDVKDDTLERMFEFMEITPYAKEEFNEKLTALNDKYKQKAVAPREKKMLRQKFGEKVLESAGLRLSLDKIMEEKKEDRKDTEGAADSKTDDSKTKTDDKTGDGKQCPQY